MLSIEPVDRSSITDDLVALVEQPFGQVRSDESGAAGQQHSHRVSPLLGCSIRRARRSLEHRRGGSLGRPPSGAIAVSIGEAPVRARRSAVANRSIIQDAFEHRRESSRATAPTMTPASTNGLRLFGRPTTSAGIPSTMRVDGHRRVHGETRVGSRQQRAEVERRRRDASCASAPDIAGR